MSEVQSMRAFNLEIDGGHMIALTTEPYFNSFQASKMFFGGLDLPATGPDDPTPDRSVITQLISTIRAIPLKGDTYEHREERFEEWKGSVMETILLELPQKEFDMVEQRFELRYPDTKYQPVVLTLTPVELVFEPGQGWVEKH